MLKPFLHNKIAAFRPNTSSLFPEQICLASGIHLIMEVGEDYCAECTDHGPITDQPQDNPAQPSSDMPPAQETSSAGPTILPHQAAVPEENICGDTTKADADKFEAQGSPVKSVRIDADSVVSEGHSASERAVRDVSISCRPYEPSETNSMVPVDDDLSMVGLRGKNNTPTSLYTDFSELQPKSTLDGLGWVNPQLHWIDVCITPFYLSLYVVWQLIFF